MEFIMVLRINLLRGGYIELTPERIEDFPIPKVGDDERRHLEVLTERAADGDPAVEDEIDSAVAECYQLSGEDTRRIMSFLLMRRKLVATEVEGTLEGGSDA